MTNTNIDEKVWVDTLLRDCREAEERNQNYYSELENGYDILSSRYMDAYIESKAAYVY